MTIATQPPGSASLSVQVRPHEVSKTILVTSALPYANGAIHIGHLVEYIQTDIWVRFQKMRGHQVYYVCADDTHGTPVMLRAEKEGVSPQALIERVSKEHQRDFASFGIGFDHYDSTDNPKNRDYCYQVFEALKAQGLIESRPVEQYFDPEKSMFLPDRFIKGGCPKCGAKDQYGDACEVCGATYSPTDLVDPYSTVSGARPIRKTSDHYFFRLSDPRCEQFLRAWTQAPGRLQSESANKMLEWLGAGDEAKLADWDISRDAPYFGFEIPGAPDKYFYVWLDAPLGYFASFSEFCQRTGMDPLAILASDSKAEMVHFIGKDILYFHALFWPAMLQFSGFRTPTHVYAHGFLTVDGAKMSKSRGTFITAESYVNVGLDPAWLRYYFAAKLNSAIEDIDLNFQDFVARINSDLVGKLINIASRSAGLLHRHLGGQLLDESEWQFADANTLVASLRSSAETIAGFYDGRDYSKAIREVMRQADMVNAFVDHYKPWALAKEADRRRDLHEVLTVALSAFRMLSMYLKPVIPTVATAVEQLFGDEAWQWGDAALPVQAKKLEVFKHLMQRVDDKQIDELIAANRESLVQTR